MKSFALCTGGTAAVSDEAITVSFPAPRRSLSTAIFGGGFRMIRYAVNRKLTVYCRSEKDLPGGSVSGYLEQSLREMNLDPAWGNALITTARMDQYSHIVKRCGDIIVELIATAGVEKTAARAGSPALYEETGNGEYCPTGTINLMACTNASLPDGIIARSLITLTEGKTAALQDLGIADVRTGLPATGSATDGITLVTDPSGPRRTDAGTFSKLGELLGSAARDAVSECIVSFDRPWNRFAALSTPSPIPSEMLESSSSGAGS